MATVLVSLRVQVSVFDASGAVCIAKQARPFL